MKLKPTHDGLLPCPFCGPDENGEGEVFFDSENSISCNNCQIGLVYGEGTLEDRAVIRARWNSRNGKVIDC